MCATRWAHARPRESGAPRSALAMLADPADHALFLRDLGRQGRRVCAPPAAEGLGRLKNPADRPRSTRPSTAEHKLSARLSEAFALVALGNLDTERVQPAAVPGEYAESEVVPGRGVAPT